MFKLLGTDRLKSVPRITPPNWRRIRDIIVSGIKEAKNYYLNSKQVVYTGHPLITYLETLPISYNLDIDSFISQVYSLGVNRTKNFGFTSSLSSGKVHTNVFFGMGSHEVIIAVGGRMPSFQLKREWKALSAIRTVRHPYSHVFYQAGERAPISDTKGACVVVIDVNLLAIQYKLFLDEQKAKVSMNGGIPLGIGYFLKAYALAGMIESNINISILNMYLASLQGVSYTKSTYRTPFNVPNVDSEIKGVIQYVTKVVKDRGLSTVEVLGNVTLIEHTALEEMVLTEGVYLNRQNTWAYLFSIFPALEVSYLLGGERALSSNAREIEALVLLLRNLVYDGVIGEGGIKPIKDRLMLEISTLRSIMKRQ